MLKTRQVWLKAVLSEEGDDVIARCCVVMDGQYLPFEVRVNVPALLKTISALGLVPKAANGQPVVGFGLKSFVKKAVKKVAKAKIIKGAVKVIKATTKASVALATAPVSLAVHIAKGERIDRAALSVLKEQVKAVKTLAPYAQMVISFVPGVGTGLSAALGAGLALASGQNITDALMAGVKGALPGGPVAAAAFDVATAIARGKPITEVALSVLPVGDREKKAIAAGIAVAGRIARGQSVDKALLAEADRALDLLPADARKAVSAGVALASGQVVQAAGAGLGLIPGGSFASVAKNLSPGAFAAMTVANKALNASAAGSAIVTAAKSAQHAVARGKVAADLIKAGKGNAAKLRPIVQKAVKTRAAVVKTAPALAKRAAEASKVKAQFQKIAVSARAGNPDARVTAAVLARTKAMRDQIAVATQKSEGGQAGLVITADGRIVRSSKGRWIRKSTVPGDQTLYRGPKTAPLRGVFSAVAGGASPGWGGSDDPADDIEGPLYPVRYSEPVQLDDFSASSYGSAVAGVLTP